MQVATLQAPNLKSQTDPQVRNIHFLNQVLQKSDIL